MRVLLLSTPVSTHFAPLVPIGWALQAAGHQVLVAGQPDLVGPSVDAGLSILPVGEAFHVAEVLAAGLPPGARHIEVQGRPPEGQLGAGARVWAMHARYTAEAYLRLAREWRPDLIVSDRLEFGARVVGAALGVPVVQHRWGVDVIATAAEAPARRTLAALCGRLGVAGGVPAPDLTLDPCPPGLQSPDVPAGTPVRFVPNNGTGVRPDWAARSGVRRRVCVSLGRLTLALGGLGLVRTIAEAAGGVPDCETVITVDAADADRLGPLPASVRVVDPVPLDLVLESCDAVVHHGGSGTELTATLFGLPQLALPQLLDAFVVGDRLEACGAGISLATAAEQNDPATVRAALTTLLDDPAPRQAAQALAAAMRDMPTPAALVPRFEELAARRAAERARRQAACGSNAA